MASFTPLIPLLFAIALGVSLLIGFNYYFLQHPYQTIDRSSVANINEVHTLHYDLDLSVDFSKKQLIGSIVHTFQAVANNVESIHLDIESINIESIVEYPSNISISYRVDPWPWIKEDPNYALTIILNSPLQFNQTCKIKITYHTLPAGLGVNWLNESQTDSSAPFFYTDCETYFCRSVAPLQDTPSIKSTYTAKVRALSPLTVLASGLPKGKKVVGQVNEFYFEQPLPIPSYLLAILAGVLEYRSIDNRIGVYAEPGMVNKSVEVLSDMGTFLNIIERHLVPYMWKNYTVVVMPFGYPTGGMENPQMAYISPAIVTVGKEAENIAAHEIVHSWFGNLITCKNWSHIWLNEGFTVYGERIIVEEFFGQDFYESSAAIGLHNLALKAEEYKNSPERTKLVCYTNRKTAEYGAQRVPYEKGFIFLKKLEGLTGRKNLFSFFKAYLLKHQYKSVASEDFKEDFIEYIKAELKNGSEILKQIDWEQELRGPGMPIPLPNYSNPRIEEAKLLAREYLEKNGSSPKNPEKYLRFYSNLKILFMIELTQRNAHKVVLEQVDADLNLTLNEFNPDILLYWLTLNIPRRLSQPQIKKKIEGYVATNGRSTYLIPIYKGISKVDKNFGMELFLKYGKKYNPLIAESIYKILK